MLGLRHLSSHLVVHYYKNNYVRTHCGLCVSMGYPAFKTHQCPLNLGLQVLQTQPAAMLFPVPSPKLSSAPAICLESENDLFFFFSISPHNGKIRWGLFLKRKLKGLGSAPCQGQILPVRKALRLSAQGTGGGSRLTGTSRNKCADCLTASASWCGIFHILQAQHHLARMKPCVCALGAQLVMMFWKEVDLAGGRKSQGAGLNFQYSLFLDF